MMNKLRPLAALALVALIGAGCGSGATSSTTGTGAGGSTAGAAKPNARAKLVKFAECLRMHGVPDFPDPNEKNEFVFGIDVSPAVWQRATTACKDLQPPGTLSARRTVRQQSAGLRFADCVRDNGVRDFPDPVNGQPLIDTTRIPSSNRAGGMTILNTAIAKCRTLLSKAAAGQ
jgi:hypothetical protein